MQENEAEWRAEHRQNGNRLVRRSCSEARSAFIILAMLCINLLLFGWHTSHSGGQGWWWVVVKFAQSYCFIVVIMEDLGDSAVNIQQYLAENPTKKESTVKKCREALTALHNNGLVHGYLRPCNILVNANGVNYLDFESAEQCQKAVENTFNDVAEVVVS